MVVISVLVDIFGGCMKNGWVILGIWNEKNYVCVVMIHHKGVEVGKIICGNFFLLYSKILFCYYKVI